MKVFGELEKAQLEPFTLATRPSPSVYPNRVIWITDAQQIQVSTGSAWITPLIPPIPPTILAIADETVYNGAAAPSLTGLFFYKAPQNLKIDKVELQIFTKGIISSGLLTLDVKKASSLNPAGFATILTAQASIDFSTAADYAVSTATLNSGLINLSANDYLRVDVTALPALPVGKFRIVIVGETT